MDFLTYIQKNKIILLDGAMGTELSRRGLTEGGPSNLEAPEAVLEIHREYAGCGCDALTTNTLTMNRVYIETHRLEVDVKEVNRAGAELARRAAGKDGYVLGDISSTGQFLEPYGTYKEEEFYRAFKEQAGVLAEGGVDAFIIETMFDLKEALCALRACKENFPLPVIASMGYITEQHGGRTVMGNQAADCARELAGAGADVIGVNCGTLDPAQTAAIVSVYAQSTSLPILVQPNAGKPRLEKGITVFDIGPEPFAEGMAACLRAGAKLVGGCCGTTPAHIRALGRLLGR